MLLHRIFASFFLSNQVRGKNTKQEKTPKGQSKVQEHNLARVSVHKGSALESTVPPDPAAEQTSPSSPTFSSGFLELPNPNHHTSLLENPAAKCPFSIFTTFSQENQNKLAADKRCLRVIFTAHPHFILPLHIHPQPL